MYIATLCRVHEFTDHEAEPVDVVHCAGVWDQ